MLSVRAIIQKAASHSPDHQPLLRLYPQLVPDAVDSVSDRHRLISPGLSYLRVGQPLGKEREYLPFPRGQPPHSSVR